ncbi:hypothetical protein [Streptomyces sp. KR80]|uniref:hypothetical protein n=1 Tax=Streptomyces sp. KR80 TaxID=3457426 RepID=UPI003FD6A933
MEERRIAAAGAHACVLHWIRNDRRWTPVSCCCWTRARLYGGLLSAALPRTPDAVEARMGALLDS